MGSFKYFTLSNTDQMILLVNVNRTVKKRPNFGGRVTYKMNLHITNCINKTHPYFKS